MDTPYNNNLRGKAQATAPPPPAPAKQPTTEKSLQVFLDVLEENKEEIILGIFCLSLAVFSTGFIEVVVFGSTNSTMIEFVKSVQGWLSCISEWIASLSFGFSAGVGAAALYYNVVYNQTLRTTPYAMCEDAVIRGLCLAVFSGMIYLINWVLMLLVDLRA